MKKFLPILFVVFAVIAFIVVAAVVKGRNTSNTDTDGDVDDTVAEIPFNQRPVASLTPSNDGHWLTLKVDNINVKDAASLDYELLYEVPDKPNQGTGGNATLSGSSYEQKLLLGSESSGKYRYDEGVEKGQLILRFRNDKGKLVGKLSTTFHLQTNVTKLTTIEGDFTFTLNKTQPKTFFLTMNTFGVMASLPSEPKLGPIGVFSSDGTKYAGKVSMDDGRYYLIDGGKTAEIQKDQETSLGVFALLSR